MVADEQALERPVTLAAGTAAPFAGRLSVLRRALANLVDNAVKYGGAARIHVEDSADALRLTVEDSGPGIPEDALASVVEPYVRLETSRSRATGGVGLGLAIARDAARLHGGELGLRNLPGGGLAATLTLPRREPKSRR
jgi:signal transduction histidine kinase